MHENIFLNYYAFLTHEASYVLHSDDRRLMLNNKHSKDIYTFTKV